MIVGKEVNHSKLVVFGDLPIFDGNMSGISSMASPKSLFDPLKIFSEKSTHTIKICKFDPQFGKFNFVKN